MNVTPKRRWFRFSLRTLFVLTVAVAALAAAWPPLVRMPTKDPNLNVYEPSLTFWPVAIVELIAGYAWWRLISRRRSTH
jgi:hypothetical protein